MATYYIAPGGSDTTGTGTAPLPWRTIQKFFDLPPQPGDTLLCRGGVYANTATQKAGFNAAMSGTPGSPITVRNYPGEVPEFHGTGGTYNSFLFISWGTDHLIIDGLTTDDSFHCTEASVIDIGETAGRTAPVSYITVRNCLLRGHASGTQNEHGIYISEYSDHITIEDNVILGPYPAQSAALTGDGIEVYHVPMTTDLLVQRNIIKGWTHGITIADTSPATMTGQILHNSFLDCQQNIYLWRHSTLYVYDNAGEDADAGAAYNINDPNDSANTTADFNFWAQTFDANYYLDSGETGWKAASDGKDAGALNVEESSPGPGIGLTHAFVSAYADGGNPARLQPSHWNAEHVLGDLRFLSNFGSPEGVVTAPVGSVYLRRDGGANTTFYIKESGTGNTGWIAK